MNKKITIGIVVAVLLIAGAMYVGIFNKNKNDINNIDQNIVAKTAGQAGENKPNEAGENKSEEKAGIAEFAQITIMRLNSGEQAFEAFRIFPNGTVERARWNSSGYLLDYAEPRNMGGEIFGKLASSPSFLNPPKSSRDNGVLGRPAFRFDMALFSGSGIRAISMAKIPDDIAKLIDEISHDAKMIPARPGWYIWTQPYPQTAKPDIDLTGKKSDSAVYEALSKAVADGNLITRTDDSIKKFISGENARRKAFEAKLKKGSLLFGVLIAK